MSTMMATTISDPDRAADAPAKPKAAKGSRSYSVTLEGAASAQLRLVAQRKTDGTAISYAQQITKTVGSKKKTSTRGMTSKHGTSMPRGPPWRRWPPRRPAPSWAGPAASAARASHPSRMRSPRCPPRTRLRAPCPPQRLPRRRPAKKYRPKPAAPWRGPVSGQARSEDGQHDEGSRSRMAGGRRLGARRAAVPDYLVWIGSATGWHAGSALISERATAARRPRRWSASSATACATTASCCGSRCGSRPGWSATASSRLTGGRALRGRSRSPSPYPRPGCCVPALDPIPIAEAGPPPPQPRPGPRGRPAGFMAPAR